MKKCIIVAAIMTVSMLSVFTLASFAQDDVPYTFLSGPSGPRVCLGSWKPSKDPALPGTCYGQTMDLNQFSASSSRLGAERLNSVIDILSSIDQRLSVNNAQMQNMLLAIGNMQRSMERQSYQDSGLNEQINRRFNALPQEILANDAFRREINKLREDILKDVDARISAKTPSRGSR
ncbi:MAG TPA: hypothetical protein VK452_08720 [Dissulfurispiraceae bacterium]|nr:hypothetical protein [Dissulfurispiraceae bacterium]